MEVWLFTVCVFMQVRRFKISMHEEGRYKTDANGIWAGFALDLRVVFSNMIPAWSIVNESNAGVCSVPLHCM